MIYIGRLSEMCGEIADMSNLVLKIKEGYFYIGDFDLSVKTVCVEV